MNYVTAALYPSWWTPFTGIVISSMPGNGVAFWRDRTGQNPVTLRSFTRAAYDKDRIARIPAMGTGSDVLEGRTSYVLAQMTAGGSSGTTPLLLHRQE